VNARRLLRVKSLNGTHYPGVSFLPRQKLPASTNCGRETFSDHKSASGRLAQEALGPAKGLVEVTPLHPINVKGLGARVSRPALTLPEPASRLRALLAGAPRWSIPKALALDRASIPARPSVSL